MDELSHECGEDYYGATTEGDVIVLGDELQIRFRERIGAVRKLLLVTDPSDYSRT